MDFYRLNQPGSEWLTRQGDAIKAARAAKTEWHKVEVPTSKPELAVFLNENARGGSVEEAAPVEVDHGEDEEQFWVRGPKTKEPPRYMTRYSKEAETRVEFVPISVSAAIAHSYEGCPKCQRTFTAQVIMGIGNVSESELDSIQRAIDLRRERLAAEE